MDVVATQQLITQLTRALQQVIVGQPDVIHQVVTAVCADGHVLLEGAPGLAKTTLVRTLAQLLGVSFGRVQCTPDLMPSDVVGTMMLFDDQPGHYALRFAPGPILHHWCWWTRLIARRRALKVHSSKPCKNEQ